MAALQGRSSRPNCKAAEAALAQAEAERQRRLGARPDRRRRQRGAGRGRPGAAAGRHGRGGHRARPDARRRRDRRAPACAASRSASAPRFVWSRGETAEGTVRFVSRKASAQTRTYRVEINIDNPNGAIPDGVTCEVESPARARCRPPQVARSALTFSSEGKLGVRTVGDGRPGRVRAGRDGRGRPRPALGRRPDRRRARDRAGPGLRQGRPDRRGGAGAGAATAARG